MKKCYSGKYHFFIVRSYFEAVTFKFANNQFIDLLNKISGFDLVEYVVLELEYYH